MATPERPQTPTDPTAALAAINRQLELANEIENPIERFFTRERLLERQDELQAEIDLSAPPPDMT